MPVIDTERRTAGRSALRYRPIETDQATPAPVISRAHRSRPDVPVAPDEWDLEEEEERVPRRRSSAPASQARTRRRARPLLFVGLGLLMTILLWAGVTRAVSWGTNQYNNLVYGYPRTFQVDAVVGQGDSLQHPSHFIAVNLHGIVTIIEFPGGDPSQARELVSSTVLGPDGDQTVVTLHFVDLNHNGKPDMLIDVGGVQNILINDGKIFRVPTPAEQQQLLQELRHDL